MMHQDEPPVDKAGKFVDGSTSKVADYCRRIERHFGRRRGGRLVLSPRDWKLVHRWYSSDIPCVVVLRGINRAFDRFQFTARQGKRINSLAYCEQEVLATWQEHRGAQQVGRAASPTNELPEAVHHLSRVAEACEFTLNTADPALVNGLRAAAQCLRELARRIEIEQLSAVAIDVLAHACYETLSKQLQKAGLNEELQELRLPRFSPYDV